MNKNRFWYEKIIDKNGIHTNQFSIFNKEEKIATALYERNAIRIIKALIFKAENKLP